MEKQGKKAKIKSKIDKEKKRQEEYNGLSSDEW